jgi:hypothetical protein
MKTTKILIFLLLAGMVSATCETTWDYCGTFNLPNVNSGIYTPCLPGDTCPVGYSNYLYLELPDNNTYNKYGNQYILTNASNVYINVVNASTGWDVKGLLPAGYAAGGIVLTTNNSNNYAAPTYASITLCLNGTYNNGYPKVTLGSLPVCATGVFCAGITTHYLSEFTQYYLRNWTFRDEINNNLYNFTKQNATLTAWCPDYTQAVYNLTVLGNGGSLAFKFKERPKFSLMINNTNFISIPRIRDDMQYDLTDNYYVPQASGLNYSLVLADYTGGQFYGSELTIVANINDTLGNIHVQHFDQSNVQTVNLLPNNQYKFIVSTNLSTRDLGPVVLDSSTTVKYVIVSTPDIASGGNIWDGLNMTVTQDSNGLNMVCTIQSAYTTTGYFSLYNTSTNPYTLITWATPANGRDLAFTIPFPNGLDTYYYECDTNDTTNGLHFKSGLVMPRNSSMYYSGFANLSIPSSILGIGKTKFLNLMSVCISIVVAGLFSAISYGTGGIVFAFTLMIFYFIGYFTTTQLTIGMIVVLACMIKLAENRFGVVT